MVIKKEIHLLYKRSENVTKWHFHPTLASHKVCLSIQNIFFSLALSNLGMLAIYSWQNNLQIQNLPFWVFPNLISQFRSVCGFSWRLLLDFFPQRRQNTSNLGCPSPAHLNSGHLSHDKPGGEAASAALLEGRVARNITLSVPRSPVD